MKSTAGKPSFQIIGVHLKSQNIVGSSAACDDKIRTFQAAEIAAHANKLKGSSNVIVVGDFNASFAAPEHDGFRKLGFDTLIKGDCSEKKLSQCTYIVPKYASIIDHIVVHSSFKEAVKGSGTIGKFGDLQTYLDTQSDHVPVWASFRTQP